MRRTHHRQRQQLLHRQAPRRRIAVPRARSHVSGGHPPGDDDLVHLGFQFEEGGPARPSPTPQCQGQVGKGTCTFDPTKDLMVSFTWSVPGSNTLTVVPMSDDHNRVISPASQPTQLTVTVVPPGGGGPD